MMNARPCLQASISVLITLQVEDRQMLDFYMTDHAEMRKQQRGFRNADVELLIRHSPGGVPSGVNIT